MKPKKQNQGWEDFVPINVPNIGSKYLINRKGQVFSIYTKKILKPGYTYGYNFVTLSDTNCHIKSYRIHKLVALTFIPNPENKPQINHIDGNRSNNCIDNLEWCTGSYNVKDGFNRGRIVWNRGIKGEELELLKQEKCDVGQKIYYSVWSENEGAFFYFEYKKDAYSYLQYLRSEEINVLYQRVKEIRMTQKEFNNLPEF